jgi:hypothetical protein
MQKYLYTYLLFSFLFIFSHNSAAFENNEHRAIGNIAFAFAKHLTPDCMKTGQANPKCEFLRPRSNDNEITYGDIVQCVDIFLTPEKLITYLREKSINKYECKTDDFECKQIYISAFPDLTGIKEENKCQTYDSGDQAAHSNHAHFQEELLVSLATYHSLAMMIARNNSKRDLGRALLVNAIADHYLQDFFAPGHIVTRRSELTDTVALAMHDYRNARGALFYVNDDRNSRSQYSSVLDNLAKIGCLLSDIDDMDSCKEISDSDKEIIKEKERMSQDEKNDLFCQLLTPPSADRRNSCPNKATKDDKIHIKDAVKALTERTNDDGKWICMVGDGYLWKSNLLTNPNMDCTLDKYQLYQRLYMVAVNVTSIMEVIQADSNNTSPTTLTDFIWKYHAPFRGDDSVYAALPFGVYSMGKAGILPDELKASNGQPLPISLNQNQNPELISSGYTETQSRSQAKDITRQNFNFENIYRASLARESFFKGDRVGRWAGSLEYQPSWYKGELGTLPPWIKKHLDTESALNFGIGVGLSDVWENDVHAGGGIIRVMAILPAYESSMNIWERRMYHSGNAERGWRNGFGLDFEQGFSSIFTINLGVGRDYGALSGGSLRQGTLFYGGISFAFPESRIRNDIKKHFVNPMQ